MFLCSRGKRLKSPNLGVSPYVLEATRTIVRGLQPRSDLMFFCPYVLMSPALAANTRYAKALAHYYISSFPHYHSEPSERFFTRSNKKSALPQLKIRPRTTYFGI